MEEDDLQPAAPEIQYNEFVCCKCWDGAIRIGRALKFHDSRRYVDLHMYQLDPAVNLYKKHKLNDEVWQVPSELVAFVPRDMLTYDAVGKGFECNQQELMSLIVNNDRPAPKPQPLNAVIRGRKRTSLDANCMIAQRPQRAMKIPDRLSVAMTGPFVASLEHQLQIAIRESLEEVKRAKTQSHDENDDSSVSGSVAQAESHVSTEVEVKVEHTNGGGAATNGTQERERRQRKKISLKRHADADVNPLAKGVQKAELCTDYVGVGVLNDRFTASIMYRGQPRFLGLFDSSTEAAKAYDEMAFRLMGYKAETNFTIRENAVPVFGLGLKQASASHLAPRQTDTGQKQTGSTRSTSRKSMSSNGTSAGASASISSGSTQKCENKWWWEDLLARSKADLHRKKPANTSSKS